MSAKDCQGHFAAFFGKPPTTASEDPEQYKVLRGRMAAVVEPAKALLELPQRVRDPSGNVLETKLDRVRSSGVANGNQPCPTRLTSVTLPSLLPVFASPRRAPERH